MNALFLKILNISISASWLIGAVLLLRPILKKAPKWISVLLWGIVAFRLICPLSIESALSLLPSAETIPQSVISGPSFSVQTGIEPIDGQINDYLGDRYFEGVTVPTGNGAHWMSALAVIWSIGVLALLIYTAVSYLRLRRRVATAVRCKGNIYQSESVSTPFVLGVLKPKIYLPFSISGEDMAYVIAHEQAHIRRKDHWWKPFGFLLLTIYWFNPLLWLAYILLCRDIELACDEKVIKALGSEQRADYTQALLSCSVNRRTISACPLAFGEVGVKDRIKSVMHYKKPTFWILLLSVLLTILISVCFLTAPVQEVPFTGLYQTGACVYSELLPKEKETEADTRIFHIDTNGAVYQAFSDAAPDANPTPIGTLVKSKGWNRYTVAQSTAPDTYTFFHNGFGAVYLISYFQDGRVMSVFKLENIENEKHRLFPAEHASSTVEGISVTVDALQLSAKNPYITILWKNETDAEYAFGKGFDILYAADGTFTSCATDNLIFDEIGILLPAGSTRTETYDLSQFDFTKHGTYRFVAGGKENQQWVDFEVGASDALNDAIRQAVLSHFSAEASDGLFHTESHILLASETESSTPAFNGNSPIQKENVYLLVLYETYDIYTRTPNPVGGTCIPTALTFTIEKNGKYALTEYWEPRDGGYYTKDVLKKFPKAAAQAALNHQAYSETLEMQNFRNAQSYLNSNGSLEEKITALLHTIQSSPAEASNPQAYIQAHKAEYAALVGYGQYTLRYCFTEFLNGGQTDLRGHILRVLLDDLAPEARLKLQAENGQAYFDAWKSAAAALGEQHDSLWLEKHQPAVCFLLQLLEQETPSAAADESYSIEPACFVYSDGSNRATLLLDSEHAQFTLSLSVLSSQWINGTYTKNAAGIIATDEKGDIYTFHKYGQNMRFSAADSAQVPYFKDAPDAKPKVCVPDGAVFVPQDI